MGKVLGNELEGPLDFWFDNWMLEVSFTEKGQTEEELSLGEKVRSEILFGVC